MGKKVINTSLEEDFRGLGLEGIDMGAQARLGGIPLEESEDPASAEDEEKKSEEEDASADAAEESDSTNGDVDPLNEDTVNVELFDAIMGLPFENLTAEDVEEILESLKESKKIPEDASDELRERAEEVVDFLLSEVAAKTVRRHKAGSVAQKKSKQCPQGFRKKGNKCVPAVKAAGGAGKLAKEGRKKKKWAKSGAGKKSARKSARVAARREGVESPFALELMGLMEDTNEATKTVRDDIVERFENILILLSEEFGDEAVSRVFDEALEPLAASWEAGRLDEDVMDEEEFLAEVNPVLSLIHRSLDRLDTGDALGN